MEKYDDVYNLDTEKMFRKIAQNSNNAKEKYQEAAERSFNKPPRRYNQRKKQKYIQIKRSIAAIALAVTMTTSLGIGSLVTSKIIDNNNAVISTSVAKDVINEKIENYTKLMNMYSDRENRIEIQSGRDYFDTNEEIVYYNEENLAKHITEAAKTSEIETRCVILAAYKLINEQYRDEIIGKALNIASGNQNEISNYTIPDTTEKLLENAGYSNWEEYNDNERNNINDLYAAEQYVQTTNRKGL